MKTVTNSSDFELFSLFWSFRPSQQPENTVKNSVDGLFVSKDSLFHVIRAAKSQQLCGLPRLSLMKRRFSFLVTQLNNNYFLIQTKKTALSDNFSLAFLPYVFLYFRFSSFCRRLSFRYALGALLHKQDFDRC